MNILLAILLIIFASIINGSFALPTKHVPKWQFENIWLNFAIWGFIILPWLIALYLEPRILQIYAIVPLNLSLMLVIGGCIFGISQICFALAMNIIGIGLGFAINLGISIGLGFALPLIIQYPQKILTPFGFITLTGTTLAIIGLIISNHAGLLRDRHKLQTAPLEQHQTKGKHFLGVFLAIIAGLGSAGQNFTFSYTYPIQNLATSIGAGDFAAANIIWPGFLLSAGIPYLLYMLYLHFKNSSFTSYQQKNIGKYYLFALIMAIFSYGSLLIYCKASQLIGALGPMIGWPMFMVLIILISSFWGWRYQEWRDCGEQAKNAMKLGIGFLVTAVIVLGYSSTV